MTHTPKTMTEIRDAEAEKKKIEIEKTLGQGLADICDLVFKAGFDCRDKLDNEALKLATDQLEGIVLALVQHGQNINPGFLIEHLRKHLAKIRELRGNE